MSKQDLLKSIADNVRKKHPWRISEERYVRVFGELPREYLEERVAYDNLVEKAKRFSLFFPTLSGVKLEIALTLEQCIVWEISRWEEAQAHNILPSDIRKLLKEDE